MIRCSCRVAWMSARRTRERAIFSSAETLVMAKLLMFWWSSLTRWQVFSTASAGQPTTWLISSSRYRRDNDGDMTAGWGIDDGLISCKLDVAGLDAGWSRPSPRPLAAEPPSKWFDLLDELKCCCWLL